METPVTIEKTINRLAPFTQTMEERETIHAPRPAALLSDSLRGRVAVVSAGTHGIGRCVAVELGQRGATVAILHVDSPVEAATVCEIVASFGSEVLALRADVANGPECAHAAEQIFERFSHIDIFVHAADCRNDAQIHQMQRKQWEEVVRTDLGAAFCFTRAIINPMRQRGHGRLIFLAESPSRHVSRGYGNLMAARSALSGLARTLAVENAARGITVNCICTGLLESRRTTEMSARERDRITGFVPAGRLGRPEDIAHAVAFLASDQAAYITGQELTIDGGLSI